MQQRLLPQQHLQQVLLKQQEGQQPQLDLDQGLACTPSQQRQPLLLYWSPGGTSSTLACGQPWQMSSVTGPLPWVLLLRGLSCQLRWQQRLRQQWHQQHRQQLLQSLPRCSQGREASAALPTPHSRNSSSSRAGSVPVPLPRWVQWLLCCRQTRLKQGQLQQLMLGSRSSGSGGAGARVGGRGTVPALALAVTATRGFEC
jgi:hypothetical protein